LDLSQGPANDGRAKKDSRCGDFIQRDGGMEVFREILKQFSKRKHKDLKFFLIWKVIDGRFDVSIKQNAVVQRMNKMGKFILFYSGDFDEMKCSSLYRECDEIEKSFKLQARNKHLRSGSTASAATERAREYPS
jgi:hypothetical protein